MAPAIVAAAAAAIRRLTAGRFGYDAVADDKRRKAPRTVLQSEDAELTSYQRRQLVATSRDLVRNYAIAAWMLRKHLDYVASFHFQSRSGDKGYDRDLEAWVKRWEKPDNFDAARRHGRARWLRIAEARRTLEGDVFALKLADGRVQAIEGDRIRNPIGATLPNGISSDDFTHGVLTNAAGAATAYALHDRGTFSGFKFARLLPARHMIHHAYFDRFDQTRGVGLIAPGINTLQDTYEGISYALAKAKVTQLFGLKITRKADEAEALGDIAGGTEDDGTEAKADYSVDFGKGPFQLDMDPGDDADFMESAQPSTQFKDFMLATISIALKSVDIPYSFFDESFTNYSGSRGAWLLYDQSAASKRQDNRNLLDDLTRWRLGLAILDGDIDLPPGVDHVDQIAFEWLARGVPWIDPLKEINADAAAVSLGVQSRRRIAKRSGDDWQEILDELEEEKKEMDRRGLTPAIAQAAASQGPALSAALATVAELAARLDDLEDLVGALRHAA